MVGYVPARAVREGMPEAGFRFVPLLVGLTASTTPHTILMLDAPLLPVRYQCPFRRSLRATAEFPHPEACRRGTRLHCFIHPSEWKACSRKLVAMLSKPCADAGVKKAQAACASRQ